MGTDDERPDGSKHDPTGTPEKPPSEMTLGELGLSPEDAPDLHGYWPGLLRGVGTEPVELPSIRGASGLDHALIAAGYDEARRRLVAISAEADAASTALAQADVQAAQSDVQVVIARAVIVDVAAMGQAIEDKLGRPIVLTEDISVEAAGQEKVTETMQELVAPLMAQMFNAKAVGSIGFLQDLGQFVGQAAQADWGVTDEKSNYLVNLSKLLRQPVASEDSTVGICPIPVYAFTADELEVIHHGSDPEHVEAILRRHDLFQYFFPAPDHAALGLIERGPQGVEIVRAVEEAPTIGHPLGQDELVPSDTTLPKLLDQLKERGYIAQVEYGYELTESGKEVRAVIKTKPREGLVSKLINRISVKINLKSILKIG